MSAAGIETAAFKVFLLHLLYSAQGSTVHESPKQSPEGDRIVRRDSTSTSESCNCKEDLACSGCPWCPACPECPTCPGCPSYPTCPSMSIAQKIVPLGYEHVEGLGYYKRHYENQTWWDAKLICELEGGHLVIVNSQTEAEMVRKRMMNSGNTIIFIGFHGFIVSDKNEIIYTTLSGFPVSKSGFNVWATNEPSNPIKDRCGSLMFRDSFGINDSWCNYKTSFMCELK